MASRAVVSSFGYELDMTAIVMKIYYNIHSMGSAGANFNPLTVRNYVWW